MAMRKMYGMRGYDTYERKTFFYSLNMKVEKEFPLLLVEKEALNKAEAEEKFDNQHGKVARGVCLFEEHIVESVSKRSIMGPNDKLVLVGMVSESQRVVRECGITAILILYGLPRLRTGYILAHEMMHAWLRLNEVTEILSYSWKKEDVKW